MKKIYNKLVRDKIPAIIQADGKLAKTRILDDEEYLQELIKKIGEEYEEFKADPSVEELADIQEVLLALAEAMNLGQQELEKTRLDKAAKRGAFKKKIFLDSVD